jgi:predicted unusual protein kinase regulating ubiquinone biosynthesis (AarF/ABC1/UbiB family)
MKKTAFLIVLSLLFTSISSFAITEKEAHQYVTDKIGPILPRTAMPTLRQQLIPMADKLSETQAKRLQSISVNGSDVFLVNSEQINAFVIVAKEVGKDRSKNLIYLTTAILKYYMADPVRNSTSDGLKMMAGIIAHELGHSTDKLDGEIEDHYGRPGSQAVEIRADNEGIKILEESGYESDGLYRALQKLSQLPRSKNDPASAAASTHPDDELRLGFQRLFLTYQRYNTGQSKAQVIALNSDVEEKIREEIFSVVHQPRYITYKKPESLKEAVERFEWVINRSDKLIEGSDRIQAVALMLWIDQALEDLKDPTREIELREKYFSSLTKLMNFQPTLQQGRQYYGAKIYSRVDQFDIKTAQEIKILLERSVKDHGLRDFRPHMARMESFEILPKERREALLTEKFKELHKRLSVFQSFFNSDAFHTLAQGVRVLSYAVPAREILLELKKTPIDFTQFKDYKPDSLAIWRTLYETKFFVELSQESHFFSINRLEYFNYYKEAKKDLLQSIRKEILFESKDNYKSMPENISTTYDYWDRAMRVFSANDLNSRYNQRIKFEELRASTETKDKLKEVAQFFWENRGLVAMLEISGIVGWDGIDWKFLGRLNGVPESTINNKVRDAVQAFLRTQNPSDGMAFNFDEFAVFRAIGGNSVPDKELPEWFDIKLADTMINTDFDFDKHVEKEKGQLFRVHILKRYYASHPEYLNKQYNRFLQKATQEKIGTHSANAWTALEVAEVHNRALALLFGAGKTEIHKYIGTNLISRDAIMKSQLNWIKSLGLSPANYKEVLKFIYLESILDNNEYPFFRFEKRNYGKWIGNEAVSVEIYHELKKAGLVKDLPDLFAQIRGELKGDAWWDADYSARMNNLKNDFINEIQEIKKISSNPEAWSKLRSYVQLLANWDAKDKYTAKHQDAIADTDEYTKALWDVVKSREFSVVQFYEMFIQLTNYKISPQSDEFFNQKVLPLLKPEERDITVRRILSQNRIYSEELRVSLAKKQTMQDVEAIRAKDYQTNNDLFGMAENLNRMAKNDSDLRDQVLEEIGWKLNLSDLKLKAYVEDEKSGNWRKNNANWMAVGSSISNLISGLNLRDKLELLDLALNHKQNASLPTWLYERIFDSVLKTTKANKSISAESKKIAAQEAAYKTKVALEKFLNSTTPLQRLPFIELLLASNKFDLIHRDNIYEMILTKHLMMEKGSNEEIMLDSFIKVIPEHEKALTLSYMLAQASGKKQKSTGNLRVILEVFQSVGIKFGQLASIWDIFGPEYKEELSELKDNAKPMSKHEIETLIRSSLDKTEQHLDINIRKVVGSASIKTVVLAEVGPQKKTVALMLQRPRVEEQIDTNLHLGRAFINELKKRKQEASSPLFMPLVDALDEQFSSEIDFRIEAENTKKVAEFVKSLKSELHIPAGWSLEVPTILAQDIKPKNNMFVVEAIDGMTLRSAIKQNLLSEKEKAEIGKVLVEVSLKMLFRHGSFDPDRHAGNWMINPKTKKLYLIDVGQLTNFSMSKSPFKWDPRLTLAQFLRAVAEKKPSDVVHYAKMMSDSANVNEAVAIRAIQKVFETQQDQGKQMTELITALYGSGIKFRTEYTFGALKGLIVLFGEGYTDAKTFTDILASEIRTVIVKKLPALMTSKFSSPEKARSGAIMCRELFN